MEGQILTPWTTPWLHPVAVPHSWTWHELSVTKASKARNRRHQSWPWVLGTNFEVLRADARLLRYCSCWQNYRYVSYTIVARNLGKFTKNNLRGAGTKQQLQRTLLQSQHFGPQLSEDYEDFEMLGWNGFRAPEAAVLGVLRRGSICKLGVEERQIQSHQLLGWYS